LQSFDWPGNVRQLEHVLLNAWVLSDQAEIDVDDLDLPDTHGHGRPRTPPPDADDSEELEPPSGPASSAKAPGHQEPREPARQTLSSHLNDEKARIAEALAACNWNRVRAAEMLGMPRRTFYRRLKQYQLQ
jgi:DNA-binding NtrC family response regulator